jgi:hypothetical protein
MGKLLIVILPYIRQKNLAVCYIYVQVNFSTFICLNYEILTMRPKAGTFGLNVTLYDIYKLIIIFF